MKGVRLRTPLECYMRNMHIEWNDYVCFEAILNFLDPVDVIRCRDPFTGIKGSLNALIVKVFIEGHLVLHLKLDHNH